MSRFYFAFLSFALLAFGVFAENEPEGFAKDSKMPASKSTVTTEKSESPITSWAIFPTSLVQKGNPPKQRVELTIDASGDLSSVALKVIAQGRVIAQVDLPPIKKGKNELAILLPEPKEKLSALWRICQTGKDSSKDANQHSDKDSGKNSDKISGKDSSKNSTKILAEKKFDWDKPRHWTIYMISSTHTDIGLHNSQYIQRKMTVGYLDQVKELVDQTASRPQTSQYRYMIEGTWVWGNYEQDRSEKIAQDFAKNYIQPGKVALGCTCAGNHTQVYGFEELCRSAYYKQMLHDRWGIDAKTMIMSDNNGMIWSIVAPYRSAGIENIIFSPNQWNPLPSTIFKKDKTIPAATWNPDAQGGGARVDVSWNSPLPMVFYWQGADDKSKLLVWCSTQYGSGGWRFGINSRKTEVEKMPPLVSKQLQRMEKRYPFDVWLFTQYQDDEVPNLRLADIAGQWNAKWRSPEFRTTGNISEPFDRIRKNFDSQIAVLRGDMTSGWSQHPVATPELLAQKRNVDVALASAEKLAALARILDSHYLYPANELRHAWDMLICNDEHSYGTSGYKGRRVFETWLQHRDWIDKAEATAQKISREALNVLGQKINVSEDSLLLFNPTLISRSEIIEFVSKGKKVRVKTPVIPSFGYKTVAKKDLLRNALPVTEEKNVFSAVTARSANSSTATSKVIDSSNSDKSFNPPQSIDPPVIENKFYQISFATDGSIKNLFDKDLKREMIDQKSPFRLNQFVYTKDNHKTFLSPENARFNVSNDALGTTVSVRLTDKATRAEIEQIIFLPKEEKRIDLDNRFHHIYDLFNKNRYYRYGYFAFPFEVPQGEFYAQLNGAIARPKKDSTGHGTDAYLAVRDWAAVENGSFGAAVIQLDSNLIEFGQIHEDKTDYGRPYRSSHLYSYLFNDWLQMHKASGSEISPRFRYSICSYSGNYRSAGLSRLAQRIVTPLQITEITKRKPLADRKDLLPLEKSFISVDASNVRFLTLKEAEKAGSGFIARFQESDGIASESITIRQDLFNAKTDIAECNITEQFIRPISSSVNKSVKKSSSNATPDSSWNVSKNITNKSKERFTLPLGKFDYKTLRFSPSKEKDLEKPVLTLSTKNDSSIQFSWKPVKNAVQYKIYRGDSADFAVDEYHLIGSGLNCSWNDCFLSPDKDYCYKVAAETKSGELGPVSAPLTVRSDKTGSSLPAPIGSFYTGLITVPKAVHGEKEGQLYLIWGQNTESDLSHYELYRSEKSGFLPDEKTFLARVMPGPYRVGLKEENGLKHHTRYFYRVRAVRKNGIKSEFSSEFSGVTRDDYR